MKESFHKSERLTKEKKEALVKKSNHPALFRFVLLFSLYLFFSLGIVVTWAGPIWLFLICVFVYGVLCCSMFACLHETVHNTAFKTLWLNRFAAFFAGIAHVYPSLMIQEIHFTHHRHTHIPGKDPEISIGNNPLPTLVSNLPLYLAWVSGLPLYIFKNVISILGALGMPEFIRKRAFPYVRPNIRLKLFLNSLSVVLVQVAFFLLAIYVNPGFWGLFLGQAVGHCFLASYTIAEHTGLPNEGTIFDKTRSIKASKLVNFIMWNMPYHAEHHAYPEIPFYSLPKLHELMNDEIMHKDKTHPLFHWMALKKTTIGGSKLD